MLAATFVKGTTEPGNYGDGRGSHGLYLIVKEYSPGRISKSWAQRITINGRRCARGLGSYPEVSLAAARAKALDNVFAVKQGGDPLRIRRQTGPTFSQCIDLAFDVLRGNWKHPRTEAQKRFFLEKYAVPAIGNKPIDAISPRDILAFLAPLAVDAAPSARKTREALNQVFNWAVAQELRPGNPVGKTISHGLPKMTPKNHHKAIHFSKVGDAIKTVEQTTAWDGTKACFTFMVLTACRSGEARLATWDEVDMDAATWTIPAKRMKGGKEHRVPLSGVALQTLERASALNKGRRKGLIFPSQRGSAMSDNTMSKLLRLNGIPAVPHGFRSSFRDWCAENNIDRQLAEAALAHATGSAVETAYLRSDMLDLRRDVMERWAGYIQAG